MENFNIAITNRDIEGVKEYAIENPILIWSAFSADIIMKDDVETISFLYDNGITINEHLTNIAIKCNSLKIVEYLLDKGFNAGHYFTKAIKTSLEMTKLIVSKCNNEIMMSNMLHKCRDLSIAKFIVDERGILPSAFSICRAVMNHRTCLVSYLATKCSSWSSLKDNILYNAIIAYEAKYGLDIIDDLISLGAVYSTHHSEIAIRRGNLHLIMYLHQRGYEINSRIKSKCEDMNDYLHEHKLGFFKECDNECERCHKLKIRELEDTWYMETSEYQYIHQWLPREMLEDILELYSISFNNMRLEYENSLCNSY